jgi:hypothetical protein
MRIVFRLVEFAGGFDYDNKLVSEEGYMLGLEATPMLIAATLLSVIHPGLVLKGPDSEFPKLSRKEKKLLKKEKKEMKRELKQEKKRERHSSMHELNPRIELSALEAGRQ